jgi:hypothetical protein
MMEVEYEIDRDDLIAFRLHVLSKSQAFRRGNFFVLPMLAIICAVIRLSKHDMNVGEAFGLLAMALLVGLVAAVVLVRIKLPLARLGFVRSLKSRPELLKLCRRHRATIDPDHFTIATDESSTRQKWSAIERIETLDRSIAFFITSNTAYIIPRRAFADEATERQFTETAERYRHAAHFVA